MEEKYNFDLYPSYIDNTNFKYLKVDNKYICSIFVYDYPVNISFAQVIEAIDKNYLYDMSLFLQKQDTLKVLKDISYYISNSKAELKGLNDSQIDVDILNRQQLDSKELRKKIQIDNEEVYKFNLFITFYSDNEKELFNIIKSFQSKLYSKQIYSNITNFRNLDSYLISLPINNYSNKLINKTYRNITTSALCNIFPFYTRTVFDKNGVIFGYTKNENRMCIIDIFDNRYLNSNITIFGSSGSGKSYFTKLLVLRHFLKGKIQYIFDFEAEYIALAKSINIPIIDFESNKGNKYINIMDIYENDIDIYGKEVLDKKVEEVIEVLKYICDINEYEENTLKICIFKTYLEKGITENVNSIYKANNENKAYIQKKIKNKKDFPCLKDVLKNILDKKLYSKLSKIIKEYSTFVNYSNVEFNRSIVFNTSNLSKEKMEVITYYLLNKICKYIKNNKYVDNVIIYIDEIWKYLNVNNNLNISSLINMLYKSIRKNKSSIVTITQDISDLFSIDNGNYGKGILNNSEFKIFFKLEFSDTKILEHLNVITKENLINISRLEKGSMILGFCNNVSILRVKASNYEHKIIEGEVIDENSSSIK